MKCLALVSLILSFPIGISASLYAYDGPIREKKSNSVVSIYKNISEVPVLENLVVRTNGEIYATSSASPTLYRISSDPSEPTVAIAHIPSVGALTGILELQQNVFIIAGTNLTGTSANTGANAVWKLDGRFNEYENKNSSVSGQLSLVARVPSAGVLNGMTRIAKNDTSQILISDSGIGSILRLNVDSGEYETVMSDATMLPQPDGIGVGVNGIHTWGDHLFYASLDQGIFAKVPISLSTGHPTGPVDVIINGTLQGLDDFALSRDGLRAYVAQNGLFSLLEIDILEKKSHVRLNNSLLGSISSAALGRSCSNWNTIYITGAEVSSNGTDIQGRILEAQIELE